MVAEGIIPNQTSCRGLSFNTDFTLPANIGELGDDITKLNLSNCSLAGPYSAPVLSGFILRVDAFHFFAGHIPKELGKLVNLRMFDARNNKLRGGLSTRTERLPVLVILFELLQANYPRSLATFAT